jgi:hypothetical protein
MQTVTKRLDSEAVSAENQLTFSLVIYAKRPHTVEHIEAFNAPLFVCVNNDFGIGFAFEQVPFLLKFFPDFLKIVYLAVIDYPDIPAKGL